jgi:tRNA-splicing ligase RtcB (3'-phosphate/5'-hydroxy nucleic acid ligase)
MGITGEDLIERGWPQGRVISLALKAANAQGPLEGPERERELETLELVRREPGRWAGTRRYGELARDLVRSQAPEPETYRFGEDAGFPVWGEHLIEPGAFEQMDRAIRLPISVAGALMPDAHQAYGLPVGGVLATEGAIIPYAIGVDIACRMRLTVVEMDPASLEDGSTRDALKDVVVRNTNFGTGGSYKPGRRGMDHPVMESPLWEEVSFVKQKRLKELGEAQLGTSGSGNHFVEIGEVENLETRERKIAILSHSGSRGVGYKIAAHFTTRAKELHPELPQGYKELAWLEMDHDLGREYHAAMTLAGEFAKANHEVIHAKILRALGLEPALVIDHHHNWAWTEEMDGRTVYVHRKGATPAKVGQMGVIPGTMGDPGYVVRGLGNPESLESTSHGAGRVMSRSRAFQELSREDMTRYLRERGITLIGGGIDEAPQAYKRIDEVIGLQEDLADVVARFTPRIVRMDAAGGTRRRKKKARVEDAE